MAKKTVKTDRNRKKPPVDIQSKLEQAMGFHTKGRLLEAEAVYEAILQVQPDHFDALHLLGIIAMQTRRPERSVDLIARAIKINPKFSACYINLGIGLKELKHFEEALASYSKAIALNRSNPEAFNNRGNVFKELNRLDEALADYDEAVAIKPNYAEAFNNRGTVLKDMRRFEEALQCFDRAIAIESNYAEAIQNRGHVLMLTGDLPNGWKCGPWRWRQKVLASKPLSTSRPGWAPGVPARRLLVWAEQGIADEIMFGRFLPQARHLAPDVLVQMDARLIPLFTRSMPEITFIPTGEKIGEELYDSHLPMQDLGVIFGNSLKQFQEIDSAYLRTDEARTLELAKTVRPRGKFVCGISWTSSSVTQGARQSFDLKTLLRQLENRNVEFLDLQAGDTKDEVTEVRKSVGAKMRTVPEVDNDRDLDGLASLIGSCDLVVSCDNEAAHLAGALGKETWVLLPFSPDWRWLADGEESYWYPSLTLFRQDAIGSWDGILKTLGKRFRAHIQAMSLA